MNEPVLAGHFPAGRRLSTSFSKEGHSKTMHQIHIYPLGKKIESMSIIWLLHMTEDKPLSLQIALPENKIVMNRKCWRLRFHDGCQGSSGSLRPKCTIKKVKKALSFNSALCHKDKTTECRIHFCICNLCFASQVYIYQENNCFWSTLIYLSRRQGNINIFLLFNSL